MIKALLMSKIGASVAAVAVVGGGAVAANQVLHPQNHGACVSAAAHAENSGATTKGQGDAHGKAVSKAAKDCHGNTASDNGTSSSGDSARSDTRGDSSPAP